MKASLVYGTEDLRTEDIPEQEPSTGEVKVQIAYAGICGSDIHLVVDPEHSGFPLDMHDDGTFEPLRLGHEYAGTITSVGDGVGSVKVGDRVSVYPIAFCGKCDWCLKGLVALCSNQGAPNIGGVGESITVAERQVFVLPENVDLQHGALVEPMAVAWHAVARLPITETSSVLIAGAGPIGIGAFLALKARGVTKILISEPNAERRAAIEGLGGTTVNPIEDDFDKAVADASDGNGFDAAIDAAGAAPALTSAITALAPRGTAIVIAIHGKPVSFDPWTLQLLEKSLLGSFGHEPQDFQDVIAAMATGGYPTDGWVATRPMAEVADAFAELRAGRGAKVLLENTWTQES